MAQLRLLLLLYARPARAMSEIMDEGSLLFGIAGAVAVWLLTTAALYTQLVPAYAPFLPRAAPPASSDPAANQPELVNDEEDGVMVDPETGEIAATPRSMAGASVFTATLTGASVLMVVALYAPFTLLLLTIFEPIGSFGVAFRRDFGPFLACLLFAWTAARVPVALAALLHPGFLVTLALWLGSLAYFTALAAVASRVVFGAGRGAAMGAAALGWLAIFLTPFLGFVASPFLLYFAWQYFRGDVGDVLWSFGARQSFKRYLAAATVNPRDADAHYQLGLIHLQRRQMEEAKQRFLKAVEIDPRDPDPHYQLGKLARAEKRYEDALRHFEAVVKRDPKHASHEVWREIGATYLDSESWAEAKWALAKFVEARDHDAEGLCRLGVAQARLGEKDAARESFRRAIESVDTSPRYIRRQAGSWRKLASEELAKLA
jgi:tetratricopeptide (TPR) repeat protein